MIFLDCSKKYKHANGLKYHQSHAHGAGSMDEDSQQLPESPRDSQQLPESPPPIQKHASNIHASPLPSSRSSLSSFESIVASGESKIFARNIRINVVNQLTLVLL